MKPSLRIFYVFTLFLAFGLYLFLPGSYQTSANTIVRTSPDDECTRTVFLQIEIFTEQDMTDEALETVADIWAQQINDRWNGPTDEEIHQAAAELNAEDQAAGRDPRFTDGNLEDVYAGNLNEYPGLQRARQELIDRANQNKQNANGASNCAIINCCKIYFHTIIQTRKPGDDPRKGFDQVEVMEPGFRSFVRVASGGLGANQGGTSGRWAFEPGDSSAAAHEAGHVMGADDFYSDVEGEDGETHSESHEGHETDLMARRRGWPKGEHYDTILRHAGKECNCCRFAQLDDAYMVGLNLSDRFAMDALAGNNCEYLRMAKRSLENQLRDLQVQRIQTANKVATARRIQSRLSQINEALKHCDEGVEDETALALPEVPFTFDSNICEYYGGGTVDLPITPFGPYIPVGPETPGTAPPTEPGTTPPGEPVIPTGPITPVTPGGTYNPELIDPLQIDTIIKRHPGIEHEGGVPKGGTFITIPVEMVEMGLTTTEPILVEIPEDDDDDETTPTPPVFIVKAEQTVLEGNQSRIEPVEGAVLKLGFAPPALPNTGTARTAEATDDQHAEEPRHVVTNEDGIGMIFVDGFESGDTSAWTIGDRPSQKVPTVSGARVDMTPTKSSIVYLTDPEAAPEWTKIRPELEMEAGIEGLEISGFGAPAGQTKPGTGEAAGGGATVIGGAPAAATGGASTSGGVGEGLKAGARAATGGTGESVGDAVKKGAGAVGDAVKKGAGAVGGAVGASAGAGSGAEKVRGAVASGDPLTISNIGSSGMDGVRQELPENVRDYVTDGVKFGNTWGLTLSYKYKDEDFIMGQLDGYEVEENHYRDKQEDDPYFKSKGSWGQAYDDQWAIKHVGFGDGRRGARSVAGEDLEPVVVAVIDTGLDWNHADISWDNIWQNGNEIPDNGIDDDMNGYIDDFIGWDFYANSNKPWDQDGHGTFIAGMIAATSDNGIGIAGMNPAAKIMVLKALNDFGHTRASFLAKAIKYAADNGARVINLSVGGKHLTRLEKMAVEYAHEKGVVIVVAAGNDGSQVSDYGLSPYEDVIAVGSSDLNDQRAIFSNWGAEIDIAAPGVDVLSLRARRTDFMRHIRNVEYEEGSAYVGEDKRYYRSSGTSFSAPIVSGVASLILSVRPELTNVEVKRMILQSARDLEIPGHDSFTGYGLLDAAAAITADPAFEIIADITSVVAVQDADGNYFVDVSGTAAANDFDFAEVSIGIGDQPASFRTVGERINRPTYGAGLALIPANEFRAAPVWTIRLVVTHKNGQTREEWFVLQLG